jgi:hypothetical protein
MSKTLEHLKQQMKAISKEDGLKGPIGCCQISYQGGNLQYGNFTQQQCDAVAGTYPGAIATFTVGPCNHGLND